MMKNLAGALIIFISLVSVSQSAPQRLPADRLEGPPMAEVLVLGTYHMGNPGRDIFNMEADDVLAPKRQAEIRELLDVLTSFRPTKIAIEADSNSPKIEQYQDYLAGKYELGRDERDQIGFRLGKELNLPIIYGIDADGDFPFLAVQDYAKAHGREKELDSLMAQAGKTVKEENEFLKSHTVLQMLFRMNSSEAVRQGLAGYALFVHFGEEYNYPGVRLLTEWYQCVLSSKIPQKNRVKSPMSGWGFFFNFSAA